jgi:hypothetical protein
MCTLTMNDKVFVLLDDPLAPSRRDPIDFQPTHYHHTFLTLSPPGALEQLLTQSKAPWIPVRQSVSTQKGQQTSGPNLVIDGHVFHIGNDWIVRVGNVILAGGAIKGMILEVSLIVSISDIGLNHVLQAEYLPLPTLHSPVPDGTSELLSNLLISVLPNFKDAKTLAITLSDAQWEDFEADRDEEDKWAEPKVETSEKEASDGVYCYGDEEDPTVARKNDWTGVERDRRSAYLIIGFLRTETIL